LQTPFEAQKAQLFEQRYLQPGCAGGCGGGGGGAGGGDGGGGDSGERLLVRTWLVDFDDLLLTDAPVVTLEAYAAALASSAGAGSGDALEGGTFASSFGAGNQPAVKSALASAFAAARLHGAGGVGSP
jgi:hypothetical protein